ncbi:phage baseplate assembly protein V [Paraburkholderia aspalathi]|nr:phage baseplate assembly protein V [Paraburkholderia aspalathi]MBK3821770.1 phage baseplate assembly protein V [Paraburkholderia aspalathi]MBK3833626.1 phage baseplate assembly protein V [Paraburkholderia aspalathi]MBK3863349.1 phage baseplate assembly protein V [Paraburkholderia aspalathi]
MSDYEIGEIDRLIASIVQAGFVDSVQYDPPRCRVRNGEWVSALLPWKTFAAGRVRTWCPPSVGEQAIVLAPSGTLAGAFVLAGFYSDTHGGANGNTANLTATDYPDGGHEHYDHEAHEYVMSVPSGGRIVFRIGETQMELTAAGITQTAPKLIVDAPDSTFTGNSTTQKRLTFQGGMTGSNAAGGPASEIDGDASFTGTVKSKGVSLPDHRHFVKQEGAPTDPPLKE